MLAHGHTKSEAQHADQMAKKILYKSHAVTGSATADPASNNTLPLLAYTDFERIWTSDFSPALLAKNMARPVGAT